MRNIEIKARVPSLAAAEATARKLPGAKLAARLHQVDTYFRIPAGRLKLRETHGSEERSELVYYERPDERGPKRCRYEVAAVSNPQEMKRLLALAFGIRCVVEKDRTVYLVDTVRIHLDRVAGLGEFLEFEVVMSEGDPDAAGEERARELMRVFRIEPDDLVEVSYADLIEST